MRAEPLTKFDAVDHQVAFQYAQKFLPDILGVKLVPKPEAAGLLWNEGSKSTYFPFPLRPRKNGYYTVVLTDKQYPVSNREVAGPQEEPTFLVGIDTDTSEMHLIQTDRFMLVVRQFQATPSPNVEAMRVFPADGRVYATFTPEWASGLQIIRKSKVAGKGKDAFKTFRMGALAKPEKFVHLHNHSEYSMLDGCSSIEGMVKQAWFNGQPGLALTDHGVMFGVYKFWQACEEWKIKPIIGCEIYVVDDVTKKYTDSDGSNVNFNYHQTILAMNQEGYVNLCELLTVAARDNFYYVPRVGHKELFARSKGLICLSGCFKGPVAWYLQQYDPERTKKQSWCRRDKDMSIRYAKKYKEVFGDRYFMEMQSNDFDRYMYVVPEIGQIADELGIPKVVTNDCHYEVEEDAAIQSIVTRVSKNKVGDGLGDISKKKGPYWVKPMSSIQHECFTPDMFERTVEIMDRCNVTFKADQYLVPPYDETKDVDWADFQASQGATK